MLVRKLPYSFQLFFPGTAMVQVHREKRLCTSGSDMTMSFSEARQDELAAEVGDFAFIIGDAGFIAHIDELAVLYSEGGRQGVILV